MRAKRVKFFIQVTLSLRISLEQRTANIRTGLPTMVSLHIKKCETPVNPSHLHPRNVEYKTGVEF